MKRHKASSYKLTQDKGLYGEYLIFNILNNLDGKVLTNLYIPKNNNKTTEIDILLIHKSGIYVIESKNYSGNIYGSQDSKYWMQILKNNKRNRFYSPLLQNKMHIKYLSKLLHDVDENCIHSLIVFSERCSIRKMEIYDDNIKVIKRDRLRKTLEDMMKNGTTVFSKKEVNNLYYKLKEYTNVNDKIKKEHIEYVENIKEKNV